MDAPSLTNLPKELLDEIIQDATPEGFESLALTCRALYQSCIPFIENHNHLRSQFHNFEYDEWRPDHPTTRRNPSAYDLIKRIAVEPVVARYIIHADFHSDTWPPSAIRRVQKLPDIDGGGPIVALFAHSPYLKEAGLDWRKYYALIQKELKKRARFSKHAATFLLTLLPNIKTLALPRLWESSEESEKLLGAIVRKAIAQRNAPWDNRPSLAQITSFVPCTWEANRDPLGVDQVIPFLALPNLRRFRCGDCIDISGASMATTSQDPYLCYGATLETVHLQSSCNTAAIVDFLKHTPRLRTLHYFHWPKEKRDWDICEFVTAIENEAGSVLEELVISYELTLGKVTGFTPGKVSMRGFQRLRNLEFPLEFAMCTIASASSRASTSTETLTDQEVSELQQLTESLVPASVSKLSLRSDGKYQDYKALEIMFFDFVARKDAWLPALKEIRLPILKSDADDAYKEECVRLAAKTEKAGVVLQFAEPGQAGLYNLGFD